MVLNIVSPTILDVPSTWLTFLGVLGEWFSMEHLRKTFRYTSLPTSKPPPPPPPRSQALFALSETEVNLLKPYQEPNGLLALFLKMAK